MSAAATPELSLVIACYREEGHLRQSVAEIEATLRQAGISHELVFVEDCSPDRTADLVRDLVRDQPHMQATFHRRNVGRGGSVGEGFRLARGQIVGFLDIDLEVHCRHVPAMVAAIRAGRDGAIAYREYAVGWSLRGLVRHVLSWGYRLLFRSLFRAPYRDTETGCKFFRRAAILPVLEQTRDRGWFWDTEIMVLAHRAGLDVVEIPCPFVRRDDKQSTVRICRDVWAYLRALSGFRWRLWSEARREPAQLRPSTASTANGGAGVTSSSGPSGSGTA